MDILGEPPVTITYNSFTFNYRSKTEINSTDVWSTDGRTIIYVVYSIKVETYITDDGHQDSDTDQDMESIRQLLQSPAGELTIAGMGWGNFTINGQGENAGPVKDVIWGPKPKILSFRTRGAPHAAKLVWTCEVAVPECSSASYFGVPMEVNTKYSWHIDQSGYTDNKTFSGFLRIPQTRASQSTRTLEDNADAYRNLVVPPLAQGFRRRGLQWDLSDDKCRIDFSIVDEEMPPNIPPPGVVVAKADHSVHSNGLGGGTTINWTGTLNASYELAKGVAGALAFTYFLHLLTARIQYALANATVDATNAGQTVLINDMNFSEAQVYDKTMANCSATYTFVTDLQHILAASGLWTSIPDSNWQLWATSMANTVLAPEGRGYQQQRFTNDMDAIVDLCQQPTASLVAPGGLTPILRAGPPPFTNPYPDPQGSFLDYQLRAILETDDQTVELKALPLTPVQSYQSQLTAQLLDPDQGNIGPQGGRIINNQQGYTPPYGVQPQPISIAQQRAAPSLYLSLKGRALRAGYLVNPPQLLQVGGANAIPLNQPDRNGFDQFIINNWYGVPIVYAAWNLRYLLDNVPQNGIGVPPTPEGGG